jgi:hypothetical protein
MPKNYAMDIKKNRRPQSISDVFVYYFPFAVITSLEPGYIARLYQIIKQMIIQKKGLSSKN